MLTSTGTCFCFGRAGRSLQGVLHCQPVIFPSGSLSFQSPLPPCHLTASKELHSWSSEECLNICVLSDMKVEPPLVFEAL